MQGCLDSGPVSSAKAGREQSNCAGTYKSRNSDLISVADISRLNSSVPTLFSNSVGFWPLGLITFFTRPLNIVDSLKGGRRRRKGELHKSKTHSSAKQGKAMVNTMNDKDSGCNTMQLQACRQSWFSADCH